MNCAYCKREMHGRVLSFDGLRKTRDHYIPVSRGGTNAKENIRAACYRCNSLKADMMPEEWEQFMLENPMWWTIQVNIKCQASLPLSKKASDAALKAMTAGENSHRMEAYREKQAEFLDGDAKYVITYGKRRYRDWVARGRPTPPYDLRPLQPGEPLPIEYPDDPLKQAAFEALYKNHRSMLRVPIWVPKDYAKNDSDDAGQPSQVRE